AVRSRRQKQSRAVGDLVRECARLGAERSAGNDTRNKFEWHLVRHGLRASVLRGSQATILRLRFSLLGGGGFIRRYRWRPEHCRRIAGRGILGGDIGKLSLLGRSLIVRHRDIALD